MSYWYRKEEPYGPYRFEDLPDLGPYEVEEYSRKPVTSNKRGSDVHHRECDYDMINLDTCLCFELYNRDYEDNQEKEEFDRWQYYNGLGDGSG